MGEIRMNADEQISDVCATTPPLAVTEELADLPAAPIVATEVFVDSSPRQPPAGLLRRGDCLVLLVVCLGCISLATVHWVRLTCSIVPPADLLRPATANPYRVEINQATWVELQLKPLVQLDRHHARVRPEATKTPPLCVTATPVAADPNETSTF